MVNILFLAYDCLRRPIFVWRWDKMPYRQRVYLRFESCATIIQNVTHGNGYIMGISGYDDVDQRHIATLVEQGFLVLPRIGKADGLLSADLQRMTRLPKPILKPR